MKKMDGAQACGGTEATVVIASWQRSLDSIRAPGSLSDKLPSPEVLAPALAAHQTPTRWADCDNTLTDHS